MKDANEPSDLTNEVIKQMYYEFLNRRKPSENLLYDYLSDIYEKEFEWLIVRQEKLKSRKHLT